MRILAVDDELNALADLVQQIQRALPSSEVRSYNDAERALKEIGEDGFKPHICFLDIEMFGTSGLLLAKKIKDIVPFTNIIFVTGYRNYALDAIKARASGYILKPVTVEAILQETENLRHPVERKTNKTISVQTFGSFEVAVCGQIVKWERSRSKELFAFLIDLEGRAEIKRIKSELFEDGLMKKGKALDTHVQVVVTGLKSTLKKYGAEAALIRSFGVLQLDREMIDCDYWRFLAGDVAAIDSYQGVYERLRLGNDDGKPSQQTAEVRACRRQARNVSLGCPGRKGHGLFTGKGKKSGSRPYRRGSSSYKQKRSRKK